ncbi:MAG: bifunctional folylpolyglutamate synthase/dihydrofolate synthase [Candidatus Nanopelagicaceae bacterium]
MSGADDLERLHFVEQELLKRWPESRLEPSLERIAYLCDALGSPQLSYPTIHITGTNGKTTTSRMIDAILHQLGYRTGRFTSPHLESITERIAINGEPISPEGFVATYDDIALYLEMVDSRMPHPLSFFEAICAMAFVAFAEYPIDVGVIEVGMGGEWDATNVVNGAVNVITPIGFDHMEYLGSTLEAIAGTKSGIIKPGSITVLSAQEMVAAKVLLERCIEVESAPLREGIEFSLSSREIALGGQLISVDGVNGKYREIFLPLHGLHQAHNATVAIAAVEAFIGEKALDEEVLREAFALVTSPGRLEVVLRDPTVIVDAAHNPHGMVSLRDTLNHEFDFTYRIGVFAPMGDKDVEGMLALMSSLFDTLVITKNSSHRALDLVRLEEMARLHFTPDRLIAAPDLPAAIEVAISKANERNVSEASSAAVVVTGSVVTVGEARLLMRRRRSLER